MNKTNIIKTIFVLAALMLSYVNVTAQCDKRDDFYTLPNPTGNFGVTYVIATDVTDAGWVCKNICRVKGPDAGVSGTNSAEKHRAMSTGEKGVGLTGAYGSVVSPLLSDGCKSITFNYFSRNSSATRNVHFYITRSDDDQTPLWEETKAILTESANTKYEYSLENIDVTGNFKLHIVNTSESSSGYGNDIIIWNICISNNAPVSASLPKFTVSGAKKTEDLYWAPVTVGIDVRTNDEAAQIHYTTDGTDPTAESTLYTSPFELMATATVKAIAISGDEQGLIADTLITIAGPQTAALPCDESFAGSLGDWYSCSVAGDWQVWGVAEEDDLTFAKISGADASENFFDNEDWLISPAFTPAAGHSIAFSFASARLYDGNSLALKYSTDYLGVGNPAAATWTDISASALWAADDGEWVESGEAAVNAALPVRFAFVYTSDVNDAADWMVGSIHVREFDSAAPSIPAELNTVATETTIALTWTASTDNVAVVGYTVYLGNDSIDTVTGTEYTFADLTAGTEYVIEVDALDAAGNRSEKATLTVSTIDETAPSAPAGLTAVAAETEIALTWTASTDNVAVAGYTVYLGNDSIDTVTGTEYTFTGLTADTEYTMEVEALDAAGNRSEKASVTQKTLKPTGIPDVSESKTAVYPNPFSNYIVIHSENGGQAVIYNLLGKPVLTVNLKAGQDRIDTSTLPSGNYLLKQGGEVFRIIKVK